MSNALCYDKEGDERDKLQQLSEVIKNEWSKDITNVPESVRKWWTFRDELAILDDVIYKGPRVVISNSMLKHAETSTYKPPGDRSNPTSNKTDHVLAGHGGRCKT